MGVYIEFDWIRLRAREDNKYKVFSNLFFILRASSSTSNALVITIVTILIANYAENSNF